MTIAGGYPEIKSGVKWIGTEGWVWVDRGGFDASNPAWKAGQIPAQRAAQGEALHFFQSPAEFSRLRKNPRSRPLRLWKSDITRRFPGTFA